MTIRSPKDLPELCEELRRQNFYGEVRLIFNRGLLTRMVTEQSQQILQERTPSYEHATR
jgi:hypothetical protein